METVVNVLDHGYVKFIEHWGSDERIIESARMSTDAAFRGWGTEENPGDEKLLKYLWKNRHTSPFEMAGATIEVMAPIAVFREWHRHRTQSYNELSGRYTKIPDVNYLPTMKRMTMQSGDNKQAGRVSELDETKIYNWQIRLAKFYWEAEKLYQEGLEAGVPKELARLCVPVGRYSKMRASGNLLNWMRFLTLRSEKNLGAQWEIRQFANATQSLLVPHFPRTMDLFDRF